MEPRVGHLNRLKRIFGYPRTYKKTGIKFRMSIPDYSMHKVENCDEFETVYGHVEEEIPSDIPEPKGKMVRCTSYIDASLVHDLATGRGCTGAIHMVNGTIFEWYSKRQATVETAVYGAEFVAA